MNMKKKTVNSEPGPLKNYDEVENNFKNILDNIMGKTVDKLGLNTEQPICVLLHNAMTEGLDFKYNPGIFLLEVPNTYGDYDQLCGRVLRTYPHPNYNKNWKDFEAGKDGVTKEHDEFIERWRLPIKVIYQAVCLTSVDDTMLNIGDVFNSNPVEQAASTIDTGTNSPAKTSSYIFNSKPPPSSSTDIIAKPIGLYDTTWAAKMYYGANYIGSPFKSFDLDQWYELLQQQTMFKKFIEILNKPTNEEDTYFEGVTDLEGIIECTKAQGNMISIFFPPVFLFSVNRELIYI